MINLYYKCYYKKKQHTHTKKNSLWWHLSCTYLVLKLWVVSTFTLSRFKTAVWCFLSKAFSGCFTTPTAPSCQWQVRIPQHFCTCQGTFLFWVPRTWGSLFPVSACGRAPDPPLSPLWPLWGRNSEHISYLEGVSGNHRWNQQILSSF